VPTRRDIRIMAVLGVVALAATLASTVAGMDTGLLHLAPALVLLLPLLTGRYVGEDRLAALVETAHAARAPRAAPRLAPCLPRAPRVVAARGGRLLAAALAGRAPPVLLSCR
jgi:hypothetical protein